MRVLYTHKTMLHLQDNDQLRTFGAGLCLTTVGIALLIITNVLNTKEHDAMAGNMDRQLQDAYKKYQDNQPLLDEAEDCSSSSRREPMIIKSTHLV